MPATIQQTYIIEQAPEVVLKGGLYYVTDRLDTGARIVRIFRPNTFFQTTASYIEQSKALGRIEAEVIEFSDAVEKLGAS